MANLKLLKQKKATHICKQYGVMEVVVMSLTHPTNVSMGMNTRLLEETNLVAVILNKKTKKRENREPSGSLFFA